jgi:hypothetical protein
LERAENKHAHVGATQGQFDRLQLAYLADQNDVGVVAHCAFGRCPKGAGVIAGLTVDGDRFLVLVHEFDRVFDRDDVAGGGGVNLVDQRRQGGGFTAAGRAGDHDQICVKMAEFFKRGGAA